MNRYLNILGAAFLGGVFLGLGFISAARADMVKWMFVFTTSAVLAILGLG